MDQMHAQALGRALEFLTGQQLSYLVTQPSLELQKTTENA